jgi:alpha-L-fucosidase
MGVNYIVMVAKHVGGFCVWQTDTTDYSIKNTPWRKGQGDIMKDLSESCAKKGIKLGVYLGPRDDYLGAKNSGICETAEAQKRYNSIYRQQLTELLTKYGDISEVWFDGRLENEDRRPGWQVKWEQARIDNLYFQPVVNLSLC